MPSAAAVPVASPSKRCTIASHEALKADSRRFAALEFHSYWPISGARVIEQRQCPLCRSTIGRLAVVATVRYLSDEDRDNPNSMIGGAA